MTLNFKKLILNAVKKQMAIQHYECRTQIFKREELQECEQACAKIKEIVGENGMLDGDYWLFFSGQDLTKEIMRETLFKIVNKACGEAANNMVDTDLKMFTFDTTASAVPQGDFDDAELTSTDDDQNGEALSDVLDGDKSNDSLDESVEEPEQGEKFVFLKITMQ